MKLKKAIKYHEEMAEQDCYEDEQLKNAKIHATYAGWLRELKRRRKQDKEMPLVCIKCKKLILISYGAMQEISYTHYSYCEDCLRKALKSEKRWKNLYRAVRDHFYEILKMEPSEAKRAKVSLANWILDVMTSEAEPEEEQNDNLLRDCKTCMWESKYKQKPQIRQCKNCKWWKDSDGEYRRGIGAESKCPINRREVMEGRGYCFMYKQQESEE